MMQDGSYSCSLLLSKSRLMSHAIPCNELEAIGLMADAALAVRVRRLGRKRALLFRLDDHCLLGIEQVQETSEVRPQ
jgi:hypothetical protein